MLENYFKSLLLYLGIDILVYALDVMTASIFDYQVTNNHLMFDIPLFFMMIFLFIFAGNRNLKDLGSKTKNLFSVSSITILGAIVASLVYSDQDRMSPLFLYWGYIAPLGAILDAMNIDYILYLC